jgi:hypothetical protein
LPINPNNCNKLAMVQVLLHCACLQCHLHIAVGRGPICLLAPTCVREYDRPMPQRRSPRLDAFPVILLALAIITALAGCGSSSTPGTSADPAGIVPAAAPLYASAVVRPSGTLKTNATTAAQTLTHQPNIYSRLAGVLQTPGSPPLDYGHDVAPWLGANAGIFIASLSSTQSTTAQQLLAQLLTQVLQGGSSTASAWPFHSTGVQGAIVLDTSDAAKARSFLNTQAGHAGAHAASYRGVAFQETSGGIAFGLVDRFAVLGSTGGLHSVINTSLGGPSLVHTGNYSKLLASAPPGALAHVYAAGSASSHGGGSPQTNGLLGLLGGTRPLDVSLVPTPSSIALDVDSLASGAAAGDGGLLASTSEGARALSELPGESWLAAGLGNAGGTFAGDVKALQGLPSLLSTLGGSSSAEGSSSGFNVKGVLEGILTPLSALSSPGARTQHDFLSWMSSAGIFASGSTIVNLRAGIVLSSKNPSLSRAAVAKLGAVLSKTGGTVQPVSIPGTDAAISARVNGLPVELDIANGRSAGGQTKFVIGLGAASVQDALQPSSTLSSAAAVSAAASALGEGSQPSVTVDFPTLLSLLEGVGLSEDASISKVVPYLRSLTTLAGGGHSLGGGIERFRLVLGLQQAAG